MNFKANINGLMRPRVMGGFLDSNSINNTVNDSGSDPL